MHIYVSSWSLYKSFYKTTDKTQQKDSKEETYIQVLKSQLHRYCAILILHGLSICISDCLFFEVGGFQEHLKLLQPIKEEIALYECTHLFAVDAE